MMEANKIAGKLTKVMASCHYVQKLGKNTFHNYKYAMATDVLDKVNNALVENGLAAIVTPELVDFKDVTNKKGETEHLATVKTAITLIDSESGETLQLTGLGSGQDAGDKAVMKAQTASIKYAWMLSLQISTGDDPEADEGVDERNTGKPEQTQKPTTKPPTTKPAPTATQKPSANQSQAQAPATQRPETGKDQGTMLGKIPQPQIAAYYARLTKVGCAPKMGEIIARTILPREAFHEDNTISWSKVSEEDFKRLCNVYESDRWETIMDAIFNRYTAKSGATPDIVSLIVQDILLGKKCTDLKTGNPMWSYVSKEDFEILWNTFRGNNWQDYFNKMNGASDLRDAG
jgi:hypothetical protein